MINILKLKGIMAEKEITQKVLAKKLGVSERTMQLRFKSKVFGTDEAEKIGRILEIDNNTLAEIFFA